MNFRLIEPDHILFEYIECLWLAEGSGPNAKDGKEKLMPTATAEIIFNLSKDEISVYKDKTFEKLTFNGSMICGVHTEPFLIDSKEEDTILGVHFRPGGIFPFIGTNVSKLHNNHFSLDQFWGNSAKTLREVLKVSESPEDCFNKLETFLVEKFKTAKKSHVSVRKLIKEGVQNSGQILLNEYSEQESLSQQRLIELFKREVGVTPKVFLGITRFQNILSNLPEGQEIDWSDISFENDFFDQAHFNKIFKKYSTITPSEYYNKEKRNPNHVPL